MPISGKQKVFLTLENILNKISEYDIYRFYLGHDFELGRAFRSPFHKDENPSFSVNINKKGTLQHMDFADSEKNGNCIDFIKQLYNIEFRDILIRIDRDFGLGIHNGDVKDYKLIVGNYNKPSFEDKPTFLQVVTRRFDTAELKYWDDYQITEQELKDNDVYAIKKLYLNRRLFSIPVTELAFAYLFEDKWKIYRPFADKKHKWMTNVPNNRMSGLHRITPGCHNAVVTKAKKDEIVLAKFIPNVCSVQSESTVSIKTENINLLNNNCKKVYLNFDSDDVGVQNCKYYNQFGFKWINCPKGYTKPDGTPIKDFSDLVKFFGMDAAINHFKLKGVI